MSQTATDKMMLVLLENILFRVDREANSLQSLASDIRKLQEKIFKKERIDYIIPAHLIGLFDE